MEEQNCEDHKHDPPTGCLLRIFWMMIGNVILLFCAYGIIQNHSGLFSIADVFYWVFVGSLLAARYADIQHFKGLTADGNPASMAHWRRYAMLLCFIVTVVWFVAHGIAYLGA